MAKVKRTFGLEPHQIAWVTAEAERLDREAAWVVRKAVQAAMDGQRGMVAEQADASKAGAR